MIAQEQQEQEINYSPTCCNCPFARHIDGDRYCCGAEHNHHAQVVRGHWEATGDCLEAIENRNAMTPTDKASLAAIASIDLDGTPDSVAPEEVVKLIIRGEWLAIVFSQTFHIIHRDAARLIHSRLKEYQEA